jgi:xanthine dehydrogenase/oxidase
VGSLAGNLMMKHDHPTFPSDIFVLLAAIGATVHVRDGAGKTEVFTPANFLGANMDRKVIAWIAFPQLPLTAKFA